MLGGLASHFVSSNLLDNFEDLVECFRQRALPRRGLRNSARLIASASLAKANLQHNTWHNLDPESARQHLGQFYQLVDIVKRASEPCELSPSNVCW